MNISGLVRWTYGDYKPYCAKQRKVPSTYLLQTWRPRSNNPPILSIKTSLVLHWDHLPLIQGEDHAIHRIVSERPRVNVSGSSFGDVVSRAYRD